MFTKDKNVSEERQILKINFLRLLDRCLRLISKGSETFSARDRAVLSQYFVTLRDQFESLSAGPSFDSKEYEGKIAYVAHYSQSEARLHLSYQMSAAERSILSSRIRREAAKKQQADRLKLLGNLKSTELSLQSKIVRPNPDDELLQVDAEADKAVKSGMVLKRFEQKLHNDSIMTSDKQLEDTVEEISSLVQNLKTNALGIRDTLKKDQLVRDSIENKLDKQMPRVVQETERLKLHLKSANKTTLASYCVILIVCILFVCTYFVIKMFPAPRAR
jgi:hypothetical protein